MEPALNLSSDQLASLRRGQSLRIATSDPQVPIVIVRAERLDQVDDNSYELPGSDEIVKEMYPLLAELAPEDWEDASNYPDAGK